MPEPVPMNGLLISVARTDAPSGFAMVSEPLLLPPPELGEQPARASALMTAIADAATTYLLSLIASPSGRAHPCALVVCRGDDNLLTGQKASWWERGY